ncbi:MAG: hypothetical protein HQK98_05305 [Nitrospirae bacterium]|nr:hypothetical protein [Nitrospirota bacterium]
MADEHRQFSVAHHVTVITGDRDAAAQIERIGRFIDDERPLSEPSFLIEFLDIYTGVLLRELEGMGIGVPAISVYDPKAVKEIKAALRVVYHAVESISEVLAEKAKRLNHDHVRDLLIEYVGAVCDYYESLGIKPTLRALGTPEAAEVFHRALNDFNPGEKRPYYFVEHVIGLR